MPRAALFDLRSAPEAHFADAGLIDLRQVIFVDDDPACREIGTFDIAHEVLIGKRGVLHQRDLRVDHFRQVVGRRIGSHADRDTLRPVDQEIGDLDRQDRGLLLVLIEVGHEVDDILVQVCKECFFRHFLQSRLRIPHRSGSVSFDIAEVAVAVDQGQSLLEVLGHDDQRLVDRAVTVGVIFTHRIADDTGALSERPVGPDSKLVHIVESSSLHGLKSVPDIRQRSRNDDAHRVVDVGFLHQFRVLCLEDLVLRGLCKSILRDSLSSSAVFDLVIFSHVYSRFFVILYRNGQARLTAFRSDRCPAGIRSDLNRDQISSSASDAWSWIKLLRGGTSLPIRSSVISDAWIASSIWTCFR